MAPGWIISGKDPQGMDFIATLEGTLPQACGKNSYAEHKITGKTED